MVRLPTAASPRDVEDGEGGEPDGRTRTGISAADLAAVAVGLLLVGLAVGIGYLLLARDIPIHAPVPPLRGKWVPHVGPGTPIAAAVALLVVGRGPALVARLGWRRLLLAAWATSFGWIFSLGMVDGWARMSARLTYPSEYVAAVDSTPTLELLRTFADRIVRGETDDAWGAHVAGHPPGALLFFTLLDRIGLGGGGWGAVVCILFGSTACVAVALALRSLDGERAARRALPFLVLVPAAIVIGVSADAVFLAVSAWGIALLAVAVRASGRRVVVAAVGAGLLLGAALYLSYGLTLMAFVALGVLLAARRVRPALVTLAVAGAAVLAVVAAVSLAGFLWWEGYEKLVVRYYQGWGGTRPLSYWFWANLAALLICTGPVVAAGLRRVGAVAWSAASARRVPGEWRGTVAVVLGASAAVLAASLSGLSKGEVERIWLPFALWLLPACALLPVRAHRRWLAGQAAATLFVQHLLLTSW